MIVKKDFFVQPFLPELWPFVYFINVVAAVGASVS
jgi:hypothetical protein